MDPNDPQDDKEFVENIKDGVEDIKVEFDFPHELGGTGSSDEKLITIATRDPLVRWFAEHTHKLGLLSRSRRRQKREDKNSYCR